MSSEERVSSLHMRMNALKERQERRRTAALGTGCSFLAVCLILLICTEDTGSAGGTAGLYSGATMMFENAGGYVAIAVTAFMAGVVITAALIRKKNRMENGDKEEEKRS